MTKNNELNHIGIIMDGNGRWGKQKGLGRTYGHEKGAEAFVKMCEIFVKHQIPYLTVYAFSTENWDRPEEEKSFLFDLFKRFFLLKKGDIIKNGVKVTVIGKIESFDNKLREIITDITEGTKDNKNLTVQIALGYGGRDEIIRAVKLLSNDLLENKFTISEINENLFQNYLDTSGIPDPELIIRTGGVQRLSNFLTWQSTYSEFYFTEVLWPDFGEEELLKAINIYQKIERRFGKIKRTIQR